MSRTSCDGVKAERLGIDKHRVDACRPRVRGDLPTGQNSPADQGTGVQLNFRLRTVAGATPRGGTGQVHYVRAPHRTRCRGSRRFGASLLLSGRRVHSARRVDGIRCQPPRPYSTLLTISTMSSSNGAAFRVTPTGWRRVPTGDDRGTSTQQDPDQAANDHLRTSFSVSAAARSRTAGAAPGNSDSTFCVDLRPLSERSCWSGWVYRSGAGSSVDEFTSAAACSPAISASQSSFDSDITPSTDCRTADLTLSARIFHSGSPGSISPLRRSHSTASASSSTTTCS
jgi:hypothetical protein